MMAPNLAHRLEDIPGIAEVVVDLDDEGGGINIKLIPGADEVDVMERLRTVLISYGVRSNRPLPVESLPGGPAKSVAPVVPEGDSLPVNVRITPIEVGARVEVETATVRSFRIVSANRLSIAQGVADTWCQVVGRHPIELVSVDLADGVIDVVAQIDGRERVGRASVSGGWQRALALAVGKATGLLD